MYRKTSKLLVSGDTAPSNVRNKAKNISNVTVGYLGKGNVFGDVDVVLNRSYLYSLKVNRTGSALFKL